MTKLLSLILASAVGQVVAIPYGTAPESIERRQAAGSPLSHFLSHLQNQTLGWYLGEEEASESFIIGVSQDCVSHSSSRSSDLVRRSDGGEPKCCRIDWR